MSFDPTGLVVYVDGEYVDAREAHVSIFDHGLLYGDGVFEGLRLFDGSLFRPYDHLARLFPLSAAPVRSGSSSRSRPTGCST